MLEDLGAQAPATRWQVVDDHQPPGDVALVAHTLGNHDAVLDHAGRRAPVVPHQVVELRDVNQQNVGIVNGVPCVGRMLAGRVVLDVDSRQPLL